MEKMFHNNIHYKISYSGVISGDAGHPLFFYSQTTSNSFLTIMSKLHQLLAVLPEKNKAATASLHENLKTFSDKAHIFNGQSKTVKAFNDSRAQEFNTQEQTHVADTVKNRLEFTFGIIAASIDLEATVDLANTKAKAKVELEGLDLPELPAVTLLQIEKQCAEWKKLILAAPTLPLGINWVPVPDLGANIVQAEQVDRTMKTERKTVPVVLYDATDKHPAQVKEAVKDENVAVIEVTKYSGLMSAREKADLLIRLNKLHEAVVKARCAANEQEVAQVTIGEKLTNFLLG